jgi:hypothetical protein
MKDIGVSLKNADYPKAGLKSLACFLKQLTTKQDSSVKIYQIMSQKYCNGFQITQEVFRVK